MSGLTTHLDHISTVGINCTNVVQVCGKEMQLKRERNESNEMHKEMTYFQGRVVCSRLKTYLDTKQGTH